MKKTFFILGCFISIQSVMAQLKTTPMCPAFTVDVLEGTVNRDLAAKSTSDEIKTKFPCFSSAEETTGVSCSGIFYKDKDIKFFTESDYIEIGEKFKGTLSLPLIGAARNSLFKWLGYPQIKDVTWEAFQTKYGILILYYNKANKVNKLQISTKSTSTIKLCE